MSRTLKCVKFELSRSIKSLLIFLGIYIIAYILLTVMASVVSHSEGSSNSALIFGVSIFISVLLMASYKNFFNNLMMFGNTRQTILSSLFIFSAILSAGLAIISLLSDYLDLAIAKPINFLPIILTSRIVGYRDANDFGTLLLYFTVLFCLCMFALLYGALEYKIGKMFIVIFWVFFGFMWTFFPVLVSLNFLPTIVGFGKWYVGFGVSLSILHASLHIFVTGLIFAGITYLVARRQPQRA